MHTFFINTSKKTFDGYDVIFDIHYENRKLISMDCPMSDWYDKDKGFISCVNKMNDLIEGYTELNNSFNLIVYIDLAENETYSSIERDLFHKKEIDACLSALRIMYSRIINDTIVKELDNCARKPRSILVMMGEDKEIEDKSKLAPDVTDKDIMEKLFGFMGLPDNEKLQQISGEVDSSENVHKIEKFKERISASKSSELVCDAMKHFYDELELWYEQIVNEGDIEEANINLYTRIKKSMQKEAEATRVLSCPYDFRADTVNKCAVAVSGLNIVLHLLKCVETESIFDAALSDNRMILKKFCTYKAEELAEMFRKKRKLFSDQADVIEDIKMSYPELELAPELREFDHRKFGLDEFGDKAVDLVFTDKLPANKNDEQVRGDDADKPDAQKDEKIEIDGTDKKLETVDAQKYSLFSDDEYRLFDYTFDDEMKEPTLKTKPSEYIEHAKGIKKHHMDYLKKLKMHVTNVLSNYAGKSKENKQALLQSGGYKYAVEGSHEEKSLEVVEKIADTAYKSVLSQYMEFCASRSVAITDVEKQCDWFVSRIHQIELCLKRIKYIALGVFIAFIFMYMPFLVIQADVIFKGFRNFSFAMGAIGVPVVTLFFVFFRCVINQRKKYIETWKEFKTKSDSILQKNADAACEYDQFLTVVIPSLRWVYEYKLDVEYYADRCAVADAKIDHHKQKIYERISAIDDILTDLGYKEESGSSEVNLSSIDMIEYNMAFCSGEKNTGFYSVIPGSFFADNENKEA